jgi:hypothetical protein
MSPSTGRAILGPFEGTDSTRLHKNHNLVLGSESFGMEATPDLPGYIFASCGFELCLELNT